MRLLTSLKKFFISLIGIFILIMQNGENPNVPSFSGDNALRLACVNPTHPDYAPLMAFYAASNGDGWKNNTNWGVTCDPCEDNWFGVKCKDGRISQLVLNSNRLSVIPKEVGGLTTLDTLSLRDYFVSGEVPAEIALLTQLKLLRISSYGSDNPGQIPSEIGQLQSLRTLAVSGENIQGGIPPEIGNLINLEGLYLVYSGLSGSIPPEIGNLENLIELELYNNYLTGQIPNELGNLSNVEVIDMGGNPFISLPTEFYGYEKLKELFLNYCEEMISPIPESISKLKSLEVLEIFESGLTGPIPVGIGELVSLEILDLWANNLTGPIPPEIGDMENLQSLNLSDNMIDGMIPKEISQLENCRIYLSDNLIESIEEGAFTNQGSHTSVYLNNNFINAPFPEFGLLNRLNLSNNQFYGCFPASYQNYCSWARDFYFDNNCSFDNPTITEFCAGATCSSNIVIESSVGNSACFGEVLTLSVPDAPFEFVWSSSSENLASISIELEESKFHKITMINDQGCTKSDSIYIEVLPPIEKTINATLCAGEIYKIAGEEISETGTYEFILPAIAGCDTLVYLSISAGIGENVFLQAKICQGDSYKLGDKNYYSSGIYEELVNIDGCISLVTLELETLVPVTGIFDKVICEDEGQFFYGSYYTESGSYTKTISSEAGCDSILTMNLTVAPEYKTVIDTFICGGESVYYNFFLYNEPGNYRIGLRSEQGCDSIISLIVREYKEEVLEFASEICIGEQYEFGGELYGVGFHSGVTSGENCEQEFHLTITEKDPAIRDTTVVICSEEIFEFNGQFYDESGKILINEIIGNCTNIAYLNLIKVDNDSQRSSFTMCEGQQLKVGELNINSSGIYLIEKDENCTPSFELEVFVLTGETIEKEVTVIAGDSYYIEGKSYSEVGNYEIILGANGDCPTILNLTITVEQCGGERMMEIALCEGEVFDFFGSLLSEAGKYEFLKEADSGCDSLIYLNLNISTHLDFEIDGGTLLCEGETLTLSGPEGYDYSWSNGATTQFTEVNSAGIYELIIEGEGICASSSALKVESFEFQSNPIIITRINPSDCDSSDGTIEITVEDPNLYSYSIDAGASWHTENYFQNLENGIYNVILSNDDQNCIQESSISVVLDGGEIPKIRLVASNNVNECRNNLGSILIEPEKHSSDLLFSIDQGLSWQDENYFEDLEIGLYYVWIKRENSSCINNFGEAIDILNEGNLEANIIITNELTCASSSDGTLVIDLINGGEDIAYNWGSGGSDAIARNLPAGTYTVTITDEFGCNLILTAELSAPEVSISLETFQDTILCEGGELAFPDLDKNYNYVLFKDNLLYYEGASPVISETGLYQVIAENGNACFADKSFNVTTQDLSKLGVDFLLSSEGLLNEEIVIVNISDPMPENLSWDFDSTKIDIVQEGDNSLTFLFSELGTHSITLLTEVNGCLASFAKSIEIHEDSTEIENQNLVVEFGPSLEIFKVFPNPSDGHFFVELAFSEAMTVQLRVLNIFGNVIDTKTLKGDQYYKTLYDLRDLSAGIYSVFIEFRGKISQQNLLILD